MKCKTSKRKKEKKIQTKIMLSLKTFDRIDGFDMEKNKIDRTVMEFFLLFIGEYKMRRRNAKRKLAKSAINLSIFIKTNILDFIEHFKLLKDGR